MAGRAGAAPADELDHGSPGEPTRKLPSAAAPANPTARHVKEVAGFEIISRLGEGGMGQVFKARQKSLDRFVALKVLTPKLAADQEYVKRFELEARAAAKLNHPNIVQVIEQGQDGVIKFIAFEFIDGSSLEGLLKKRGRLPEREALKIVREIADALRYSSEKGLIHRDVKPDNILLTKEGVPKLADMGLAKLQGDSASLTQAGIVMGTPHYMAPEQALGERDLDVRADLYALGLVLYRCLVGELPWHSDSALAILTKHINEDVPDPRGKVKDVSEATVTILRGLTHREREDRYSNASDVVRDLDSVLAGSTPTGPVAAVPASGPALVATVIEPAPSGLPRTRPNTAPEPQVTASGRRGRPPTPNPATSSSAARRANPQRAASGRQAPQKSVGTSSGARAPKAAGVVNSVALSSVTEAVPARAAMPIIAGLVLLALCSGAAVAMLYDRGRGGPPVAPSTSDAPSTDSQQDPKPDSTASVSSSTGEIVATGTPTPAPSTVDPSKVGTVDTPVRSTPSPSAAPQPAASPIRESTVKAVREASAEAILKHEKALGRIETLQEEIKSDSSHAHDIELAGLERAHAMVDLSWNLYRSLSASSLNAGTVEQRQRGPLADLAKIGNQASQNELEATVAREAHDWADLWGYFSDLVLAVLEDRAAQRNQVEQFDPRTLTGNGVTAYQPCFSPWLPMVSKNLVAGVQAFDKGDYGKTIESLKDTNIEAFHRDSTASRKQVFFDVWPVFVETYQVLTKLSPRLKGRPDLSLIDALEKAKDDSKIADSAFVKLRYAFFDLTGPQLPAWVRKPLPGRWVKDAAGEDKGLNAQGGKLGEVAEPLELPSLRGMARVRLKLAAKSDRHYDLVYVGTGAGAPAGAVAFVGHEGPACYKPNEFAQQMKARVMEMLRELPKKENPRFPGNYSSSSSHTEIQDIALKLDKDGMEVTGSEPGKSSAALQHLQLTPDSTWLRLQGHNIVLETVTVELRPGD